MARESQLFACYLLTGVAATAVHYALLVAMVELAGLPAAPSAAFGATAGALVAYAANRRYTFPGSTPHGRALPRFLVVAAIGAAANGSIVWAGTELLYMHYLAAQLAATALVVWSGFTPNRRWTFA
jgi:putative flippase GtrA